MDVNLNYVFLEELEEEADGGGPVARLVIIRECKASDLPFDESAASFYPLE
jgi:hypothetical protein